MPILFPLSFPPPLLASLFSLSPSLLPPLSSLPLSSPLSPPSLSPPSLSPSLPPALSLSPSPPHPLHLSCSREVPSPSPSPSALCRRAVLGWWTPSASVPTTREQSTPLPGISSCRGSPLQRWYSTSHLTTQRSEHNILHDIPALHTVGRVGIMNLSTCTY